MVAQRLHTNIGRIIGSIISCASQNIGMLVVGRIINGFAVGIESAQVPVYIAEISPPSKRGRFIGMQQWAITWGILIMYYISYGCAMIGGRHSSDYSTAAFRVPWGLQMVPGVFLFFMMMLLPESPRWLARKDRWDECHGVLTLVHGHGDPDHPFVALELQDIKDMCAFEASIADVTYLDLFKPNMINRTVIGIFTQIWSQLTGMNVMSKSSSPPYRFDANNFSVLHILRLLDGRIQGQRQPSRFVYPVHHQRLDDHPRPSLDG